MLIYNLCWLDLLNDDSPFPPLEHALTDPNGLIAIGGSLRPKRLIMAYRYGIFPWYSGGQQILWWSPDPRSVLYPERLRVSHSLKKILRKQIYHVTVDKSFRSVIQNCAAPRAKSFDTWITAEMLNAYVTLHEMQLAHSVEIWRDNNLVGGLYGVAIGRIFYGESMFSFSTDASKVALFYLAQQLKRWQFAVIDCQVDSPHLQSLGAENISRQAFKHLLINNLDLPAPSQWYLDDDLTSDPI